MSRTIYLSEYAMHPTFIMKLSMRRGVTFFIFLLVITNSNGEKYLKILCKLSQEFKRPYLHCLQTKMSNITRRYIDNADTCIEKYYSFNSAVSSLEKLGGCKGRLNVNSFIDCMDQTDILNAYLQESRTELLNRESIAEYCLSLIKHLS
ncbi:uncharacterized protein [Centruroides vittatus]|uniref:uncharacterized protein n=1 Tax=Centruroides vittatus TaxID=120091 RepID=UPI00350EC8E2